MNASENYSYLLSCFHVFMTFTHLVGWDARDQMSSKDCWEPLWSVLEPQHSSWWCCICTRLGNTCCNQSLRFEKEGVSKQWGVPGSSNLPRFCGKSLSLLPVRLAISLRLGQRCSAKWVSNFSHRYHRTRGFLCRHYDARLKDRYPYLEVR